MQSDQIVPRTRNPVTDECSFNLTDDDIGQANQELIKEAEKSSKPESEKLDFEGVDEDDLNFLRELEKENQALEMELLMLQEQK